QIRIERRRAGGRVHHGRERRRRGEQDQDDETEGDRVAAQEIHSYNLEYEGDRRHGGMSARWPVRARLQTIGAGGRVHAPGGWGGGGGGVGVYAVENGRPADGPAPSSCRAASMGA